MNRQDDSKHSWIAVNLQSCFCHLSSLLCGRVLGQRYKREIVGCQEKTGRKPSFIMGRRSRFMMTSISWMWWLLMLETGTILQTCHSLLSPLHPSNVVVRSSIFDGTTGRSLFPSSSTPRKLTHDHQNPSEDLDASSSSLWPAKTRILQDMVQTLQHERDALRHRLHQLQQQPPTDNNGHDEEVPNSTGTDWQDAYYQQWLSKPSTKVAWDAHIREAQSQWETQHVRPLQQDCAPPTTTTTTSTTSRPQHHEPNQNHGQ